MQLKLRIHLYFQRIYVINPANGRKKEYHKRVSPIVRIGGRSKETHMPRIKQKNTANPNRVNPNAHTVFFPFQAANAPKLQQTYATTANNIKYSQLIPFPPLSSFVHSQTDKRPRASS